MGFTIAGGTIIGAVAGGLRGDALGSKPSKIRSHGLYYTGIVSSKKLSREITQNVFSNNAAEWREPETISSKLQNLVKAGKISLLPAQIIDIEAFYRFAYESQDT